MKRLERILCPLLALLVGTSGCGGGWGVSWKEAKKLPDRSEPKDVRVTFSSSAQAEFKNAYVAGDSLFGYVQRRVLVLDDSTRIDLYKAYGEEGFLTFSDSTSVEVAAIVEALQAEEAAFGWKEQDEAVSLGEIEKVEEERFGLLTLGGHFLLVGLLLALLTAEAYIDENAATQ